MRQADVPRLLLNTTPFLKRSWLGHIPILLVLFCLRSGVCTWFSYHGFGRFLHEWKPSVATALVVMSCADFEEYVTLNGPQRMVFTREALFGPRTFSPLFSATHNRNLFRFMIRTSALSWPEQFCQWYIPKVPRPVIFMDGSIIAPWGWVSETGRLFFTDILKFEGEIRILQGVSVAFVSVSCTEYIICSYKKNTKIYTIQDIINYAKMWGSCEFRKLKCKWMGKRKYTHICLHTVYVTLIFSFCDDPAVALQSLNSPWEETSAWMHRRGESLPRLFYWKKSWKTDFSNAGFPCWWGGHLFFFSEGGMRWQKCPPCLVSIEFTWTSPVCHQGSLGIVLGTSQVP